MTTKTRKPAGRGQAFKDYRGDGAFPQENHEAFSHNCQQENYSSVHLLADLLDKHLALRNEEQLAAIRNRKEEP